MSNPQDSPKTLEELVDLLRRIYNPGAWTQRQLDAAVQLIQSFIDTQKAEVTEDAREFVEKILGYKVHGHLADSYAQQIATRDQKLMQEAVKPWREFVEDAKRDYDSLDNVDQSAHWGHMAEAARALLSQPQEVK